MVVRGQVVDVVRGAGESQPDLMGVLVSCTLFVVEKEG